MRNLKPETWRARARFLRATREFFHERGYIELTTPCLADHANLEPYLDPYEVRTERGRGFLITSPEHALKRALGQGLDRIFEIAHCFRGGERGNWHAREFLMLEWYARGMALEDMMEESESLVRQLLGRPLRVERLAVADFFARELGHDFKRATLEDRLRAEGVAGVRDWSYSDLFFKHFLRIENRLQGRDAILLHHYPAELAAYARTVGDRARRFEIYVSGVELANAYEEETRPELLMARCREMNQERQRSGRPAFEADPEFLNALGGIQDPLSGIALGLERLFALSLGLGGLEGATPFPSGPS